MVDLILSNQTALLYSHTSSLIYKGRQWEGGIREPFYIKWPGSTTTGQRCDTPVIGTDLYPTLLELAGLPLRPNQHVDGLSLVPLLKGQTLPARPLFWHYPHY